MSVNGQTGNSDGGADVVGANQLEAGPGFGQFVAQARLANAQRLGRDSMAANAAEQVAQFRANSTLRKDEWVTFDENLVDIARDELKIVNDLRSEGLTVSEDLSTLIREWETHDDFGSATVDMAAEASGDEDDTTFTLNGTPLPIVSKPFHIKHRRMLASRTRGQSLPTINQSKAARAVMEKLEDMVLNGWGGQVDTYSVDGLTSHTDRNTTTANSTWDGASATDMLNDIYGLVEALEDANYPPGGSGYRCYINRQQWQEIRRKDTGTDQERGVLARVEDEFDYVDFAMTNYLDDGEAIMFKPVEDVIELAVASDITNVEWSPPHGFGVNMKVMASITPIVKSDDSGASGIVHMTGA